MKFYYTWNKSGYSHELTRSVFEIWTNNNRYGLEFSCENKRYERPLKRWFLGIKIDFWSIKISLLKWHLVFMYVKPEKK